MQPTDLMTLYDEDNRISLNVDSNIKEYFAYPYALFETGNKSNDTATAAAMECERRGVADTP
jgi:hypothetical protein